jgi:hypothetical protein
MKKNRIAGILVMMVVLFLMVIAVITMIPIPVFADSNTYAIGDTGPGGGMVFYDKGYESDDWRYLEVAIAGDPGLNVRWLFSYSDVAGTSTAVGSGMANTLKILALNESRMHAAKWCADYSCIINGVTYNDWFLPSRDELYYMFANLDFNFLDWPYWSSSQFNASQAYFIYEDTSDNISENSWDKTDGQRALPVRAFSSTQPSSQVTSEIEKPVWKRDTEMSCKAIWINEKNCFQFSFIYPYANNNWVKIYDMTGKIVYEVDMPYDNPNIIVNLPDGRYTVKTFHDQPEPLQEFVVGKP